MLACSVYVNLNPIRAGIAKTPETSEYTSAYVRIEARQAQEKRGRRRKVRMPDAWLSPVPWEETRAPTREGSSPADAGGSLARASDGGYLPLKLDEYLDLLDWTGRQVRRDKRGAIPGSLKPILDRLQVGTKSWVESIEQFDRWLQRAAGRLPHGHPSTTVA